MNLKLIFSDSSDIPNQLRLPNFLFNDEKNEFLNYENKFHFAYLENINRINFFVGANNSGKSRFLRGIYNTQLGSYEIYKNKSVSELINILKSRKPFEDNNLLTPNKITASNRVSEKYNVFLQKTGIIGSSGNEVARSILKNFLNHKNDFISEFEGEQIQDEEVLSEFKKLTTGVIKDIEFLFNELQFWETNNCNYKVYIPPLRSLLKSGELGDQSLSKLAVNHLKVNSNQVSEIFDGLGLYDKVNSLRNSKYSSDIKKFEKFLGKNFFNGSLVELIPDERETKLLLMKIDEEEHRSLSEIGDGIQAIILLLYPIYTAKNKSWFFIEEPETHMHPGLQRIFLETLINDEFLKEKQLKFFFTTHSNHFLDIGIQNYNTSIFQFNKIEEGRHLITSNIKPNKTVLDVLGVNTSSVFLANTSLWVEGPTDRKYLSKFLKLYCEAKDKTFLKEDIDFAFFEYGGSLITHYLFDEVYIDEEKVIRDKIMSFALSNRIYLLADSDNATEEEKKGKRSRFLEKISSTKESNFKYQNTEVKEIENLLPADILKSFMNTLLKNKQDIENLKSIRFKNSEYETEGIGHFLMNQFKKVNLNQDSTYKFYVKSESGTLETTYKNKLCQHFVESEITYNQLIEDNPVLENIIIDLYSFIENKPYQK